MIRWQIADMILCYQNYFETYSCFHHLSFDCVEKYNYVSVARNLTVLWSRKWFLVWTLTDFFHEEIFKKLGKTKNKREEKITKENGGEENERKNEGNKEKNVKKEKQERRYRERENTKKKNK